MRSTRRPGADGEIGGFGGFFDPKAIAGLAEAHIAGRADHSRTLWQLLMLEKSLTRLGASG